MPHSKSLCYEFGPFKFNVAQRLMTRAGAVISLAPKATEVLLMLLRNSGEIVGKEDLMKEVWPDSFVEEANLTQNIFTLRRALGDTRSDAKFIETVARKGYRFVGPVNLTEESASVSAASESVAGESPILAVLPFANATGDEGLEYLAEGVGENVINNLSHISKLRVMSRSAVFRYKGREIEPRIIHEDLGVNVLLLGKIASEPSGLRINVVLVNAATGWQLWGESFKCDLNEILEIQDEIVRQISAALGVKISGEEERRITTRYTENSNAYQAYIEGRFYWSRYTRSGIELAIERFQKAIDLDPNYALAYAGIVDCYLRLATNYLPPERQLTPDAAEVVVNRDLTEAVAANDRHSEVVGIADDSDGKIRLRHEWDWKRAERELRRANELKADYPAAHQWHAVYRLAVRLLNSLSSGAEEMPARGLLASPIISKAVLSPNEEIQVLCTVAREQIEVGNYEAACLVLKNWWTPNEWPRLEALSSQSAADLLFTAGSLAGCLSSSGQLKRGQKHAEALLSGAISLCELLGLKRRCAEGYVELALCYYRQGIFDLTRTTLLKALADISPKDAELRSVALIRLAVSERHAGCSYDSLARLNEARDSVELGGALVTGRYHHELATTLKDLAVAEGRSDYADEVRTEFEQALYEFDAIGHHRYSAVVENNFGFLLLNLKDFEGAKIRLLRARRILEKLGDKVRQAQVDDTLARLYVETSQLELADKSSFLAVSTLENGDEEALLAEALTTRGLVLSKLGRTREARSVLEGANRIAERCGDTEGAGRALLIIVEEIFESLGKEERLGVGAHIKKLLGATQQPSIRLRLESCLRRIGAQGP